MAAKEISSEIPLSTPPRLEDLPFVQERLKLITGPLTGPVDQRFRQDRTTKVVEMWQRLNTELQAARKETMSCLEATEGKGGAVVLKIADRPRFDSLQTAISDYTEKVTALEDAIRKLNAIGIGWFSDLESRLGTNSGVEPDMRRNIASITSHFALRHAREPTEKAFEDPEFVRLKKLYEDQISNAKAFEEKHRPTLKEAESILKSVGC